MNLPAALNRAQVEILEMTSFVKTDEMLSQMKEVIANYFARLAQAEVDKLWATGELNPARIEEFRHLHQRTPYK